MITRCNQCGTKFEVSAELVKSEDPTVRCGECLSVFDARAQLIGGDSISNYQSVSTGKQAAARRTTRSAVTAPVAEVSKEASREVAHSVSVDQYAHISDEDLENAATVVVDQTLTDDNLPAATRRYPAAGDRGNDEFYSPDLSVDPIDARHIDVAEPTAPNRAGSKIDPSFTLAGSMDNTNLEFERTLALENYSAQTDVDAQVAISDKNEETPRDRDSFRNTLAQTGLDTGANSVGRESQAKSNWGDQHTARAEHPERTERTERTEGPKRTERTVLAERTGLTENAKYSERTRREFQPDLDGRPDRAVSPVVDPAEHPKANREYPRINDIQPDDSLQSFESLNATADPDRHLSPEELGVRQSVDTSDFEVQPEAIQGVGEDQDSARGLRSYVSSGGGAVVSGSEAVADEKKPQSSSMLKPLLLVCVLAVGMLYIARDTVSTMNLPDPVLSAFCGLTGCELPMQKEVEQLELIRHQMSSHKALDNVLVFTVDLINRAKFPQPYPVLVVTMANSSGESVAFRKFQPDEYLEEDPALTRLPAGKPVRITFEIVDPGPEALSTELSFE